MLNKKVGNQTFRMDTKPYVSYTSSIGGAEERKGPLKQYFDILLENDLWDEDSWEKAESKIVKELYNKALSKSNFSDNDIQFVFGGDLLNQCIAATFGLRDADVPFFGLYGACSTFIEGMAIASMLIDGGFADNAACVTSSHFYSAERQYRAPADLGNQRTPTAQRTVTGGGCAILTANNMSVAPVLSPRVEFVTVGKITDYAVDDNTNMGAAMAPAAAETIVAHFQDTGRSPLDYQLILTGDLGEYGFRLCKQLCANKDYQLMENYNDCGRLIYDIEKQDAHAGASGCGCIASVFSGYIMNEIATGKIKNILLIGTGALFSPVSCYQGETIPGIAHAVSLVVEEQ